MNNKSRTADTRHVTTLTSTGTQLSTSVGRSRVRERRGLGVEQGCRSLAFKFAFVSERPFVNNSPCPDLLQDSIFQPSYNASICPLNWRLGFSRRISARPVIHL
ncbi:hypothetical protein K443DRAFT_676544 [Laccaria amethystina LaAM-08-1]|uniref:Unplaced genomic scaffold K443scaffold_42, whole genome shotgun sequence n=1 Tax=Laccaria amethystina LaAM-08-1 TaxID=1095629 RepID=A0A0C9XFJ9_9AGAR|nr:hypothetical protein K443DRAFT_676544 [Laccaria amethystina LaAM-08-1]